MSIVIFPNLWKVRKAPAWVDFEVFNNRFPCWTRTNHQTFKLIQFGNIFKFELNLNRYFQQIILDMQLFKKSFQNMMEKHFHLQSLQGPEVLREIESFHQNHDIRDYKLLSRFSKDLFLILKMECPVDEQISKDNYTIKKHMKVNQCQKDLRFSMEVNENLVCEKCSKKDSCPLFAKLPPQKKGNIAQLLSILVQIYNNEPKILIKNYVQLVRVLDTLSPMLSDLIQNEGQDSKLFLNVLKEQIIEDTRVQDSNYKQYTNNFEGKWEGVKITDEIEDQNQSTQNQFKTQKFKDKENRILENENIQAQPKDTLRNNQKQKTEYKKYKVNEFSDKEKNNTQKKQEFFKKDYKKPGREENAENYQKKASFDRKSHVESPQRYQDKDKNAQKGFRSFEKKNYQNGFNDTQNFKNRKIESQNQDKYINQDGSNQQKKYLSQPKQKQFEQNYIQKDQKRKFQDQRQESYQKSQNQNQKLTYSKQNTFKKGEDQQLSFQKQNQQKKFKDTDEQVKQKIETLQEVQKQKIDYNIHLDETKLSKFFKN